MKKIIIIFLFLGFTFYLKAQDTLKVDLQQADSIFITNNFYLLASAMNIEAQKALVLQAKLYPNPVFSADLHAYDPENKKAFYIGPSGQKAFQLEQLILLGGKKKSEIEIAKTNSVIAELEFQQLIRKLKFRLRSELYAAGQQQLLLSMYNAQLALLDTLLSLYQTQVDEGNLPLKDLVRLKSAYLKLNNDRTELLKQCYETQAQLQTLLQTTSFVEFQFSEKDIEKYIQPVSFTEIQKEALISNPDFLILQQNKTLAEQYLQYQKRLAIPDIDFYVSYDQRADAFNNQINAGFAIPLPLWNRNQGNIKAAQFKLKETDYQLQATQNELLSNLKNYYSFYVQAIAEYQKAKSLYNQDFGFIVKGMVENFQKRNISIVEFIDFFESYNETLTEITQIRTQLVISSEQLNMIIGKDIL